MNIVYFDLETQKSADEVGGWGNKQLMRVSFGVTYSSETKTFKGFEEEDMPALISELQAADLVIGYNIISFDYPVLSYYTALDFSTLPSFDLMVDLKNRMGVRLKLDNVAQATLQTGKSAHGLTALKWFHEGEFAQIALYCKEDVRITRDVHLFGCEHQFVYYHDKKNQLKKISVDWSASAK